MLTNARYSILLILFCLCTSAFANRPLNLDTLKQQLIRYQESGNYHKEISHEIHKATNYLKDRIRENNTNPQSLAIVLDIDETALSNFKGMRLANFCNNVATIQSHIHDANDPAISSTLNLYRLAKEHGVAVFFVTGRPEKYRKDTEKNLKSAGYYAWTELFMRPDDDKKKSPTNYKTKARKNITEQGYQIIINIGDQDSDLKGGYAEKTFKLANPFYTIV